MESITETLWDVVICGTGIPESLLALSLSRSGKKILHVDPHDYYGGTSAALSLQDAEAWAARYASPDSDLPFRAASITVPAPANGSPSALSFSRAYSLALSPQLIHARSDLLAQLVSSRAYRQVEFVAVGAFFVLASHNAAPALARVPSTREDVFSAPSIPPRAKRALMKLLKLALDLEGQSDAWRDSADLPLEQFLRERFAALDEQLLGYVRALTLSLERDVSTQEGLDTIHRHLTSMGAFGPGFAAVYPKWGGLSEVAQVACRAAAVGGAVYMLDTDIGDVEAEEGSDRLTLELLGGRQGEETRVQTQLLVQGGPGKSKEDKPISRLVVIVDSPLKQLFETTADGAPIPAVAVVAIPPGFKTNDELDLPIYVVVHSSDTGECPAGQSILYLTTITDGGTEQTKARLQEFLEKFLSAIGEDQSPRCLYRLYYEHWNDSSTANDLQSERIIHLPRLATHLALDDSTLKAVRRAWEIVMGSEAEPLGAEYMVFPDRGGAIDNEDDYEY